LLHGVTDEVAVRIDKEHSKEVKADAAVLSIGFNMIQSELPPSLLGGSSLFMGLGRLNAV
jgi:hypothetical protein